MTAPAHDPMDSTEKDVTGMGETPEFRISSFCCSGKCVAVAFISGGVLVRHHHGPGPTLEFSTAEWAAFIEGVHRGEFDAPDRAAAS